MMRVFLNSCLRMKSASWRIRLCLLRREGSNLRPSGYEPDELPLLYFAMWTDKFTIVMTTIQTNIHFLSLADEVIFSAGFSISASAPANG